MFPKPTSVAVVLVVILVVAPVTVAVGAEWVTSSKSVNSIAGMNPSTSSDSTTDGDTRSESVAGPSNQSGRVVYVTTGNDTLRSEIRADHGIRFTFPEDTFSSRLPREKIDRLRDRNDATVEPVRTLQILPMTTTLTSRTATPSDQTPYGIETIYDNTSLDAATGGNGIDVAVLDTGTTKEHPDLENRVELCRDYSGGGSGFDENSCDDGNGHGTHVSGTVLADAGDDGNGIYGVAPAADLYAFKVCNNGGLCFGDSIAAAIRDAADANAEVISMSLGGSEDSRIQDAIQYAHERGTLIVAAAGNSGDAKDTMEYPGADVLVVGVGATNKTDRDGSITPSNYRIADFSSRGKANDSSKIPNEDGYMEVAAPGVDILSTANDGTYERLSGTSMATPHVSGLAAKIWPAMTDRDCDGNVSDDVRHELQTRALDFDVERGTFAGPGYEVAAGLGQPMVKAPISVTPTAGTGVLDGDDDCRRLTHLHDDGDPADGGRSGVVHLTSHDTSTMDYALAVVDTADVKVTDVSTLEFDYYEGANNTNAAPDEVWLVLANETGRHVVYRTFNDGTITPATDWRTQQVGSALTDSDRPWVEVEIDQPVKNPRQAMERLSEDNLTTVGENLTAVYGEAATVLAVGVGHGAPRIGSTTVDLYVDDLTLNATTYEFPHAGLSVDPDPLTLNDGTDRVNVTIDLEGDWAGRTVHDVNVRTIELNGTGAIPGSSVMSDVDGDTQDELRVQFLKPQIDEDLSTGDNVPITVTGVFADDEASFAGTAHIAVQS